MKAKKGLIFLGLIVLLLGWNPNAKANWYAGSERPISVDGVTALISTPSSQLNFIEAASSGESNWISTYNSDSNGIDWLSAGWLIYWWENIPKQ